MNSRVLTFLRCAQPLLALLFLGTLCLPARCAPSDEARHADYQKCRALQLAAGETWPTAGPFEAAIKAFHEHLRHYPGSIAAATELAVCYEAIGKPRDALNALTEFAVQNKAFLEAGTVRYPDFFVDFRKQWAWAYEYLNDYPSALAQWQLVLKLKPELKIGEHVESLRRALKEGVAWRQWLNTNRVPEGLRLDYCTTWFSRGELRSLQLRKTNGQIHVRLALNLVYAGRPENQARALARLDSILPQVEAWYAAQGIHLEALRSPTGQAASVTVTDEIGGFGQSVANTRLWPLLTLRGRPIPENMLRNTIAHEIGHYLGFRHPAGGWSWLNEASPVNDVMGGRYGGNESVKLMPWQLNRLVRPLENAEAHRLGTKAWAAYTSALRQQQVSAADEFAKLADECEGTIRDALRLDAHSPTLWGILGCVARTRTALPSQRRSALEQEREAFSQVVKLDPEDAEAWATLAEVHAALGDANSAIAAVSKAIHLDNTYGGLRLQRARLLRDQGDRPGAAEDLVWVAIDQDEPGENARGELAGLFRKGEPEEETRLRERTVKAAELYYARFRLLLLFLGIVGNSK